MTVHDSEFRELVYDLLCGEYNLRDYPVPESTFVENEFIVGGICDVLYAEMSEAYDRLCLRLGVEGEEDKDVEIIIDNLRTIGRHTALKMFEYGVFLHRKVSISYNKIGCNCLPAKASVRASGILVKSATMLVGFPGASS